MILERVALRPFGGTASREVDFAPGLNVVLGPNEAGKSTLTHAILHVLYTPSGLTRAKFEREMGRFLPLGGGDTIAVELAFADKGERYTLRRRWGSAPRSELVLPNGSITSDDGEIAAAIEEAAGVKEGTFKSILVSSQMGLQRTLEELKDSGAETLHTLGDILRRSVLETDGVSVDRFRKKIHEAFDDYYRHWDVGAGLPERGRGVRNPYTKGVGRVLAAYYGREAIEEAHERAKAFEEKLDGLNRELSGLILGDAEKVRFLEGAKDAVQAARNRIRLRFELEAARARLEALREANRNWPVWESRLAEKRALLETLDSRVKSLEGELEDAEREERGRALSEAFARARSRGERVEKLALEAASLKRVTREELEELREASALVQTMRALPSSKGLALRFGANTPVSVSVEVDRGAPCRRDLEGGETAVFEATERVKISHENWELVATGAGSSGAGPADGGPADGGPADESPTDRSPADVRPGDERPADTRPAEGSAAGGGVPPRDLGAAEARLAALLRARGVETLEHAVALNGAYEDAAHELRAAEEALRGELSGKTLAQLEAECAALGGAQAARPIARVAAELGGARSEGRRLKDEAAETARKIVELAAKYGSQERLFLEASELVRRETELIKQLESLPPLPEGSGSEEQLIAAYDAAGSDHERLVERIRALERDIAHLEGVEPGISAEELRRQLDEAREAYLRVSREAAAVSRVRDLAERLLLESDRSTYAGMREKLEGYVAALTGDKYRGVRMSESLPEGFITGEGKTLARALLSTGTRDALALALRLSMAEYFLQGKEGVLVMDDPLVNLDPGRQSKAAELLAGFAERRQVLLFTCHPQVADLLGAVPIRL